MIKWRVDKHHAGFKRLVDEYMDITISKCDMGAVFSSLNRVDDLQESWNYFLDCREILDNKSLWGAHD